MKTISGKIVTSRPISLSKAAKFLTTFVEADTEASHAVSAYLRRTSAAFNELTQLHRQLRGSRSDRTDKKQRSLAIINSGELYESDQEGSRDPGPASRENPVVESGREKNFGDEESGGVRKKKRKRSEGGECDEGEGSRDSRPTSDANPSVDSGVLENGTGIRERKETRIEGRGGSGNFSEKGVKIEEGEDSVRIEAEKKKNKEGKSGDFSEKQGEIEDCGREGEESVGVEVRKKKKRKIIEAEGVGSHVSEERHKSKKKRRRKSGGVD